MEVFKTQSNTLKKKKILRTKRKKHILGQKALKKKNLQKLLYMKKKSVCSSEKIQLSGILEFFKIKYQQKCLKCSLMLQVISSCLQRILTKKG